MATLPFKFWGTTDDVEADVDTDEDMINVMKLRRRIMRIVECEKCEDGDINVVYVRESKKVHSRAPSLALGAMKNRALKKSATPIPTTGTPVSKYP
jgi:hypothetical protein